MSSNTDTSQSPADARAREVEQQMTDDERFSLLVSVCGENLVIPTPRDERIPEGTPMSSGYTPGVPRLGVPALLMSDASMGVINPGFADREGDTASALKPGESRRLTIIADPRLLARFDAGSARWRIAEGVYRVALGRSAEEPVLTAAAPLASRLFGH